ncbi:MAG: alpha/beta hydrolase [Candidatus Electrothrix aestuarii]|uniref:Alpha/beta hydrolase n=1 Tax=Candidatus Electrothrix aestuarii TaxID=3062594 RepID=A0AAU8LR33_9BACT|nr:alpha/beta hydrolase [Candidatus Electrothrix aestuarii]
MSRLKNATVLLTLSLVMVICSYSQGRAASGRAKGEFVASEVCNTYLSLQEKSNPGNIMTEPGKAYPLVEWNKGWKSSEDFWYRIIMIQGDMQVYRWVYAECGTAEGAARMSAPSYPEARVLRSGKGKVVQPRVTVGMAAPPVAMAQQESMMAMPSGGMAPSGDEKYARTVVFFATDREKDDPRDVASYFGGKRGRKISYGTASVSIPRDHKMGELEKPSIWRLEFRQDPEKHVVLLGINELPAQRFYEGISQRIKNSEGKKAFIFIHGYNVTFEDAARRTAQMAYDLAFDGAPIFYSWPSHGKLFKYAADEENIRWSERNIEDFLLDFTKKSDAESIYLVAHSMGNRGLTRAYVSLLQKKPELHSRFKEVILAAPDIDVDIFTRDIVPIMAESSVPVTLYVSANDKALEASRRFHNAAYRRVGDTISLYPHVETIDSSNVKTDFLGHSYFGNNNSVIADIFNIVKRGLRPDQRPGLAKIFASDGIYWRFRE